MLSRTCVPQCLSVASTRFGSHPVSPRWRFYWGHYPAVREVRTDGFCRWSAHVVRHRISCTLISGLSCPPGMAFVCRRLPNSLKSLVLTTERIYLSVEWCSQPSRPSFSIVGALSRSRFLSTGSHRAPGVLTQTLRSLPSRTMGKQFDWATMRQRQTPFCTSSMRITVIVRRSDGLKRMNPSEAQFAACGCRRDYVKATFRE